MPFTIQRMCTEILPGFVKLYAMNSYKERGICGHGRLSFLYNAWHISVSVYMSEQNKHNGIRSGEIHIFTIPEK